MIATVSASLSRAETARAAVFPEKYQPAWGAMTAAALAPVFSAKGLKKPPIAFRSRGYHPAGRHGSRKIIILILFNTTYTDKIRRKLIYRGFFNILILRNLSLFQN
jgi:hypothetical protein